MTERSETTPAEVRERTRIWIEEAVIDLEFCPFAASFYEQDRVRITVSEADAPVEAMEDVFEEAQALLDAAESEFATTLVVFSVGLDDFRRFLDVAESIRCGLEEAGAEGLLQVATFHPDYQFAGTDPGDLENFTNRAPFPTLHLLREEDVTRAVEEHPDPKAIPERNIERLREMGRAEVERIWEKFS